MKTYLFIDGSNLFMGLVDLFGCENIPHFKNVLRDINKVQKITKVFFYCSYMLPRDKSQKEKKLLAAEAAFYTGVKSVRGLYFYKGHRSQTSKKEKGVDVHLAIDIVKNAFLKKCDQIMIMTGDADLVYPIEIVKKLEIKTQAIFIPTRFSPGLSHEGGRTTVLNYLEKFKPENKFKKELPAKLNVMSIKMASDASTRGK